MPSHFAQLIFCPRSEFQLFELGQRFALYLLELGEFLPLVGG